MQSRWANRLKQSTHGSLPTLCLYPPGMTLPYSSTGSPDWPAGGGTSDDDGLPAVCLSAAAFLLLERENRLVIPTRSTLRIGEADERKGGGEVGGGGPRATRLAVREGEAVSFAR